MSAWPSADFLDHTHIFPRWFYNGMIAGRMRDPSGPSLLDKLPPELLDRVVSHLDNRATLSLIRVCKALTGSATDHLWRHIDISVPRTLPYSKEYLALRAQDRGVRDQATWMREIDAHRAKERLDLVRRLDDLEHGGVRWDTVRTVKTGFMAGCAGAVVRILKRTAPNLRDLEIVIPPMEGHKLSKDPDPIDVGLLQVRTDMVREGNRLSFPSLVHITLGRHVVNHIGAIPLLCQLAPNLQSLSVSIVGLTKTIDDIEFPRSLSHNTKLTHLRLSSTLSEYRPTNHVPIGEPSDAILDLISRSPDIRALSLTISFDTQMLGRLAEKIAGLDKLQDLYWDGEHSTLRDRYSPAPNSACLRRLVLGYEIRKWEFPAAQPGSVGAFPSLEVVHIFSTNSRPASTTNTNFPPPTEVLPIRPSFALWLNQRPCLRSIYFQPDVLRGERLDAFADFDSIEETAIPNCRISSMRRDGAELVHVQLRLCNVVISFTRDGERKTINRRIIQPFRRWHTRKFQGSAWQSLTYYDGVMVPMQIVRKMKKVEDPTGAIDWQWRGVEVGAEAWAVLTDWRQGQGVADEFVEEELGEGVSFAICEA